MQKKSSWLPHLFNLALRPIVGQTNHLPQQPPADDRKAWSVYWNAQGQSWRTEPEIDTKRQQELAQRRTILPDIQQGIYPFRGMKLSRADVEWLLATHEHGRGPVDWKDENQHEREGLDLRGADLSSSDLKGLPLARLRGGLTFTESMTCGEHQAMAAMIKMDGAFLRDAHLEGAILSGITLKDVFLRDAYLQQADLSKSKLLNVKMRRARLAGADLHSIHLENSYVPSALFAGSDLSGAHLIDVNMDFSQFGGARLTGARFERVRLKSANFENAYLNGAILKEIYLEEAQLQGANLRGAQLESVELSGVILSDKQHIGPALADMQWERTNLTVVDWSQVKILADEKEAHQKNGSDGRITYPKSQDERIREYQAAVRANRQLAVALQSQGLNEEAARFAYRAQVLQKKVLWYQMTLRKVKFRQRMQALAAWLFSWFLYLLAGYGYRLGRSFLAYLFVISLFMTLYHVLDPHLAWNEAFVVSMTAFHGRGFSPSTFTPGDAVSVLSALEAFIGLIIEVTFIATLTQRFFNR